jgi:hypothetical protein
MKFEFKKIKLCAMFGIQTQKYDFQISIKLPFLAAF